MVYLVVVLSGVFVQLAGTALLQSAYFFACFGFVLLLTNPALFFVWCLGSCCDLGFVLLVIDASVVLLQLSDLGLGVLPGHRLQA